MSENPQEIKSLDAEISKIQKSTRTSVPAVLPLHDLLRQKYRWYYRWSLFPSAGFIHAGIVFLFVIFSLGLLANLWVAPEKTQAAGVTCYWVGVDNPDNWNDPLNWSGTDDGTGGDCDGGLVPGSDDDVIFNGTITTSCNLDTTVTVQSITNAGTYSGTLDGAGQNVNLGTVSGTGNFQWDAGALDLDTGTWTVAGDWETDGLTPQFTPGTSLIVLTGTTKTFTIRAAGQAIYNLTVSGSYSMGGTWRPITATTGGILTVNGTFTVNGNNYINLNVNGSKLVVGVGGTIQTTDATGVIYLENPTISTTGTIDINVIVKADYGNWTLPARAYNDNLTLQLSWGTNKIVTVDTGTLTVGGNFLIDNDAGGTLTINADTNDPAVDIGGIIDFTGSAAGETLQAGSNTWNVAGNIVFTGGTFTHNNGTFILDGATTQSVTSATNPFYNFNCIGSSTITLADKLDVTHDFKQSTFTGTFDAATFNVDVDNDFQFDAGALDLDTGTWTVSGNWDTNGSAAEFAEGTSTIVLTGGASKTLYFADFQDFYNITVTGSYTTYMFTLAEMRGGTLTVSGTLTLGDSAVLDFRYNGGATALTGGTINGPSNSYIIIGNLANMLDANGTINVLVVAYAQDGNTTLPGRTYGGGLTCIKTYGNLTTKVILGSGAGQTITVTGDLNVDNNDNYPLVADAATKDPTVNVSGNVLIHADNTANATLQMGDGAWDIGGYIDFTGATAGTEIIEANNATVNVAGSKIDLTGGTLTPGTSEFILDGGATQTITSATNSFYDLTVTNSGTTPDVTFADNLSVTNQFKCITSDVTLRFTDGTTATLNDINLDGQDVNYVTIQGSGVAGYFWNVASQTDVSFVSVSYSDATPGITIDASNGTNFDGGHNTEWNFISSITISGTCQKYDQSTPCADPETIKVAINNVLQLQTDTTETGVWSIAGVSAPVVGDVITVFVDGVANGLEANAVTVYTGPGDVTDILLYEEHLTIGSNQNNTVTNANLSQYDNTASGGNEDIFFDVNNATNDLTVDYLAQSTQEELYIKASNIFQPDSLNSGNVNTFHLEDDGTITADGNTITIEGNADFSAGTFTAGSSNVVFSGTIERTFTPGTSTFNNITLTKTGTSYLTISGTATVSGNVTHTSGRFYSGQINLAGNYSIGANATGSTSIINFNHASNDQSISYTAGGIGAEPRIDKTGGTFSISTDITVSGFHYIQGVTSGLDTYTLTFGSTTNNGDFTPGSLTYANITLTKTGTGYLAISGTATVSGNVTHTSGRFYSGQINLAGNYSIGANATGSTSIINFNHASNDQSISYTAGGIGAEPRIDKTGGTFSISTDITVSGFHYIQGVTSGLDTYTLTFGSTTNNGDFTPGSLTYANITLTKTGTGYLAISGTATVSGNVTHTSGRFHSGQINLAGNYSIGANATGGTSAITLNGTGTQTYSIAGGTIPTGAFTINKASGDTVLENTSGSNYTLTHSATTLNTASLNLKASGAGNMIFNADANDPTVNLTGDLDYTGVGDGTESVLAGGGTWNVGGSIDLTGGTITADGSTIIMNGDGKTINGTLAAFNNLTITGTISTTGTDFSVSGALAVADTKSLTIGASRTLTMNPGSTTTITGTGAIAGSGTLTLTDGAGANLSTTGILSSIVRFDTALTDAVVVERTFGGKVEFFNNTGTAFKAVFGTLGGQILTFSNNIEVNANAVGNMTLDANANAPAVILIGTLDFIGVGDGAEIILAGSGTWNVGGDIDFTGGTFTHNNGTFVLNGVTTQSVTSDTEPFYNFNCIGSSTITLADKLDVTHDFKQATFTGTFNAAAFDVDIDNDFQFDSATALQLGTGTWTVGGNWDTDGLTAEFEEGTSTIIMNGADKNFTVKGNQDINNLTISGSVSNTPSREFLYGTLNVSGTFTLGGHNFVLTTGSNSIITGTINGPKTLEIWDTAVLDTGGTINSPVFFSGGNANPTMPARIYGNNVTFQGRSDRNLIMGSGAGQSIVINGNLSIDAYADTNCILNAQTNNPTVDISGNIDFTGTGTGSEIILAGDGDWNVGGNINLTDGTLTPALSEFILDGAAQQNITSAANPFNDLTIKNTSANGVRPVGTLNVSGDLKVQADGASAVTLDNANNVAVNVTGGLSTTGIGGGAKNLKLGDNIWTVSGNVDFTGGTITDGASTLKMDNTKNLTGGSKTLNNLQISGAVTLTNSNLTVAGVLTIDNTKQLTINVGLTLIIDNGSTVLNGTIAGAGAIRFTDSAGANLSTGGTLSCSYIEFHAFNADVTVPERTYGGRVTLFNPNAAVDRTVTLGTAAIPQQTLTFQNDFYVSSYGTNLLVTAAVHNPNIIINGNFQFYKNVPVGAPSISMGTGNTWTIAGHGFFTDGTVNAGGSTLIFNGAVADQFFFTNALTFNNLQINNIAAAPNNDVIVNGALDVNGAFTLTAGNLDLDTNDPTVNIAGNITLNGGSITKSSTGALVTFDGDLTYIDNVGGLDFGNIAIGASPDTTNLGSNIKLGHLQINGGDVLITNGYDIDAGGNITTIGTLNATAGAGGATQINLGGNWNLNGGVYTKSTSTVIFDGTNQSILGSTSFNNLSKTNGSVILTFEAGATQTISGNLTLTGTAGNLLKLYSSATPTKWLISVPATKTLNYLSVKDSNNTGVMASPLNSTDEGNNINWFIPPIGPCSATVSTASASPTSLEIGQTSTITITLKDAAGTRLAGHSVSVTSDQAGDNITFNAGTTDAQGQILAYLTSAAPHTSSLTIADTTDSVTLNNHPQITFTAPAIDNPSNFAVLAGDEEVGLSWVNPIQATFDHINIYRSTTSGELGGLVAATAGTSHTDTGLTNGVTYFYTLKAVDSFSNLSSGTSQLSALPQGETIDILAPTAPSNLRALTLGAITLTLGWDASTDDTGVTGYQIFNASSGILVGTTTGTSYSFGNLTPETTYVFYVRAYDAAGNFSPNSNTLEITTSLALTDEEKAIKEQGGLAAFLVMSGLPEEVISGQAFPKPVKITVADLGGNVLSGYTKAVFFSSSDSSAQFTYPQAAPYTFSPADGGSHQFAGSDFKLSTEGLQKITVSDYSISETQAVQVGSRATITEAFQKVAEKISDFLANPENRDKVNTGVVTTTAAVLVTPLVINTALGLGNLIPQLLYWATHMLQALGIRRRRKPWGVVFNSQTGQPIGLAIVRLLEPHYNRVLEQSVTDSQGRYGFLTRPGTFYLKVKKAGFKFPPAEKSYSAFYEKVYLGDKLKISDARETVAFSIPLDPLTKPSRTLNLWIKLIRLNRFLQKIHLPLLLIGFLFALIMLIQSGFGFIFLLSVGFYLLAGILEYLRSLKARPYGVVTDTFNHPLETAIIRIYQKSTNRLVETDVTDRDGRFKFLVVPGVYYLTAAKPGYIDFKSHLMYLQKEKTLVSTSIKLKKVEK